MKKISGRVIFVLVAEAVVLLLLLFGKWLGIEAYFYDSYTSLMKIGSFASDINEFIDGNAITILLTILIYGGLFASLAAIVLSFLSAVKRNNQRLLLGLIVPGIFDIVVLLLVPIGNAVIRAYTDGWITSLLGITPVPIIVLLVCIIGIIGHRAIPQSVFDNAESTIKSGAETAKSAIQNINHNANTICPNCGTSCKSTDKFCLSCGTKLQTTVQKYCMSCGSKLPPQSKFCPTCGLEVTNANDNSCVDNGHLGEDNQS